jgi:hypothetical protein
MLFAAAIGAIFGINAESRSLEDTAAPLSGEAGD